MGLITPTLALPPRASEPNRAQTWRAVALVASGMGFCGHAPDGLRCRFARADSACGRRAYRPPAGDHVRGGLRSTSGPLLRRLARLAHRADVGLRHGVGTLRPHHPPVSPRCMPGLCRCITCRSSLRSARPSGGRIARRSGARAAWTAAGRTVRQRRCVACLVSRVHRSLVSPRSDLTGIGWIARHLGCRARRKSLPGESPASVAASPAGLASASPARPPAVGPWPADRRPAQLPESRAWRFQSRDGRTARRLRLSASLAPRTHRPPTRPTLGLPLPDAQPLRAHRPPAPGGGRFSDSAGASPTRPHAQLGAQRAHRPPGRNPSSVPGGRNRPAGVTARRAFGRSAVRSS